MNQILEENYDELDEIKAKDHPNINAYDVFK